jgi:hypothetical protein
VAIISRRRVRAYLRDGDKATTTTGKGLALENAVEYVFSKVPGINLYDRNVVDVFGCAEADLVFSNEWQRSGMGFLDFGLIVECKNLARRVGSADVESFRTRLEGKGARTGVLVAAGGLSGDPGTHAFHAVETALTHGCHIIVLTRPDLETVSDTGQLVGLLLERFMELKTHGTMLLR